MPGNHREGAGCCCGVQRPQLGLTSLQAWSRARARTPGQRLERSRFAGRLKRGYVLVSDLLQAEPLLCGFARTLHLSELLSWFVKRGQHHPTFKLMEIKRHPAHSRPTCLTFLDLPSLPISRWHQEGVVQGLSAERDVFVSLILKDNLPVTLPC